VSGVCRPPQGEVDRCPKGAETQAETQTRRKAHLASSTPPSPPPAVLPPAGGDTHSTAFATRYSPLESTPTGRAP
jgi:hypothetical protein